VPSVDIVVESKVSDSSRVQQLSAMFDVPLAEMNRLEWHAELPIEKFDWNVGLIVGPSGCGKSTIARRLFGSQYERPLEWSDSAVIDDFDRALAIQDIAAVCQAVGFNTIPAWMRRFAVLSNGERFRVELARRLLETCDTIVVDEFTSVVDRQVAQIGSHAVQKYVRKNGRRFVAVSCHYDIVDWLQPDWIFEPATLSFARRSLQCRPAMDVTISRCAYSTWKLFAPFHYLTADLHKAARCFGLWVGDRIAAFAGMLHRPHPRVNDVMGLSRLVTLPDWQGLGLALILSERLGAAYKALGKRFHTYPAHPALIRSFGNSTSWKLERKGGDFSPRTGETGLRGAGEFGGRPCAVFSYAGNAMNRDEAELLVAA
jgi:ABC-type iron transport system FetAB ATPase subunit